MKIYILQRLISLIPVLLFVAVVVFFIIHLTPGDPAAVMLGADASPAEVEALRQELGLDRPIIQQFFSWFGGLFTGDLGTSIFLKAPVFELFVDHLGPTLSLSVLAQGFAMLIAIPMGIVAAKRRGTVIDQTFMVVSLLGISLPGFLLALLLSLIFAVQLGWLPAAGYRAMDTGLWQHFKYLIMPAAALGFIQASLIARMTRSSMLDVLSMNYIKTARAKGVKDIVIVYKHALRNAFIPILTVIGQTFGNLIAGTVVIESVFSIPGVGQLLVQSIISRDYAVLQGVVLLIAASYVLINLIVDLLYGVVDPRVRLSRRS
ncbi:ABC transporter permease [Paenibacillus abyssi]|uniref:ABC transporter permease n=1 Tax=Paenibacillus abyssi TaxID=1340531 RepID=A0A917FZ98_9BACL|nr:ABC transporter permease [Paenibacillus abyssi]GGG15040.1 ABC transporter permease [Paenibacillus abyssi]